MTTAARPTFDPARGGGTARDKNAPIRQVSARDQTAHTKLKYRQPGQGGDGGNDRDALKAELRQAELEHLKKTRREKGLPELGVSELEAEVDGRIADKEDGVEVDTKRIEDAPKRNIDADDSDDDSEESDSDDSDDDDEDDTAALMAELEKIKRERAEEKERQEREQAAEAAAEREEEVATGNPLLNIGNPAAPKDFSVKRRWDDDVIFKNQARGVDERPKKRFINDTLRSDFHRKFMSKYVQ